MNRLAGTLAHAHDFSALDEPYELNQHNVQFAAVQTNRVHGALHSGDVAVMVGSPDVNTAFKAAFFKLISMIGDVRREIRWIPVLADKNLIFFRAEIGGTVPERAVLFVGQALLFQNTDGFRQFTVVVQAAFQKPFVVNNAVFL